MSIRVKKKEERLLLHTFRSRKRLTARDNNPLRDQAINQKIRGIEVKFHAGSFLIRHVDSGIPPCVGITSLKKVVCVATNAISHMLRHKESPTRSRRSLVRENQLLR